MFNTKNVNEGSEYLKVGINSDVTIMGFTAESKEGSTPYVEISLAPTSNLESINKFRLYFSEKAASYSLSRIKHIATKCVKAAQIDAIEATTVAEYAAKLTALLKGRRLRILLNGSEYMRNDGGVGVRTELPMANFAEALSDGAEYAPVSESCLPDAKIKKLAETPSTMMGAAPTSDAPDW
jgi:hypothetical protein